MLDGKKSVLRFVHSTVPDETGRLFASRSAVGPHMTTVEAAPTTMDDVEKSGFGEALLGAMKAELGGHKEAGTYFTSRVPDRVNVVSAKWVFSWKTYADGTITKAEAKLVARGFGQR